MKQSAPNGWTVGPSSTPQNLGELLERYEFNNVYHQSGMALEIDNIINFEGVVESLEVIIIENNNYLRKWSNFVSKSFNNININIELLRFLRSQEEFTFFGGFYEDELVSALMRVDYPTLVTGLHAVSTLSEYRGNGFALKLSEIAIIDAKSKSCEIAVLQASSLGEKVYRK